MVILNLSNKAFNQYQSTANNQNIDYDMACRKMTRNMLLAKTLYKSGNKAIYQYGSLRFEVKNGLVKWIKNHTNIPTDWKLNKKEYIRLTKELQIDEGENITYISLVARDMKYKMKRLNSKLKHKMVKSMLPS